MTSTTSAQAFFDLVKNRRSYYNLTNDLPIPRKRVQELVNEFMIHCPTPYNIQSTRVVILFGEQHEKLWETVSDLMVPVVSSRAGVDAAKARFTRFKDAAATILFFDDTAVIEGRQARHPFVKEKWPIWATQANAMLQFSLWMALDAEGVGCNLQHYNPEIDEKAAATFGIPADWKLNAQLVIGGGRDPSELPEKTVEPLEKRIMVLGD